MRKLLMIMPLSCCFFAFFKIIHIFDRTNQIFLPYRGCLIFIKKGEEIRLCETLATNSLNSL
jgi:hypothetical protein